MRAHGAVMVVLGLAASIVAGGAAASASPNSDPSPSLPLAAAPAPVSEPGARAIKPRPTSSHPSADPVEAVDLGTELVVGRRAARKGTVTRVTAAQMERSGARSVDEVLDAVPGVAVQRHPKSGATVHIRGFDERATLLLVDDVPVREVYSGHLDVGSLLVESFEVLEVDRGVTSVLYGPNALAGVLHLRSRRSAGADARLGQLRVYGGQWHAGTLYDAGASLLLGGRPWRSLRATVALGYHRSEGTLLSSDWRAAPSNAEYHEDGGVRDGSDYERLAGYGRLEWSPAAAWRVSLAANSHVQERGIPDFEGGGRVRYWRFADYSTHVLTLSAEHRPSSRRGPGWAGVRLAAYLSLHADTLEDFEDSRREDLTTSPLAWFAASEYRNSSAGLTVFPSWRLGPGNRLHAAAMFNGDTSRQRELPVLSPEGSGGWDPWARHGASTAHAALEDTQRVGPVRLVAGAGMSSLWLTEHELREQSYAVDTRRLQAVDGRALVDWQTPWSGLRFMASAGRKTRFPTLKELFANVVGGNPGLLPERAWMVEVGCDGGGQGALPLDARWHLRGFHNSVSELITWQRQRYENVAQATTAGMELGGGLRPWGPVGLDLAYTYLYTWDDTQDRELDYRSRHSVRAQVNLRGRRGTSAFVQAVARSRQVGWRPDPLSGEWRAERLPGHVLLGARLRQDWAMSAAYQAHVALDVSNLLDTNYVAGSFAPQAGRRVHLGLGTTF